LLSNTTVITDPVKLCMLQACCIPAQNTIPSTFENTSIHLQRMMLSTVIIIRVPLATIFYIFFCQIGMLLLDSIRYNIP